MKLPSLGRAFEPLIVPFGHLAIVAALAEEEMFALCASLPFPGSPDEVDIEEAAHKLRNWNWSYINERLALITDADTRELVLNAITRFEAAREKRNRLIHDALIPSLKGGAGQSYELEMQAREFRRIDRQTSKLFYNPVDADQVAALACEMDRCRDQLSFVGTLLIDPPSLDDDFPGSPE
jgi:hypothetical protein